MAGEVGGRWWIPGPETFDPEGGLINQLAGTGGRTNIINQAPLGGLAPATLPQPGQGVAASALNPNPTAATSDLLPGIGGHLRGPAPTQGQMVAGVKRGVPGDAASGRISARGPVTIQGAPEAITQPGVAQQAPQISKIPVQVQTKVAPVPIADTPPVQRPQEIGAPAALSGPPTITQPLPSPAGGAQGIPADLAQIPSPPGTRPNPAGGPSRGDVARAGLKTSRDLAPKRTAKRGPARHQALPGGKGGAPPQLPPGPLSALQNPGQDSLLRFLIMALQAPQTGAPIR